MAVPVAPAGTLEYFRDQADQVVCLATPEPFGAVGYFYDDFSPTSDAEVIRLMRDQASVHAANPNVEAGGLFPFLKQHREG